MNDVFLWRHIHVCSWRFTTVCQVRLQLKLVISETISYYQEPPKTNRNHFIYQEPLKKYKPFHNARNLVETI